MAETTVGPDARARKVAKSGTCGDWSLGFQRGNPGVKKMLSSGFRERHGMWGQPLVPGADSHLLRARAIDYEGRCA